MEAWIVEGDYVVKTEPEVFEFYERSIGFAPQDRNINREALTVVTRNGGDVLWPQPVVLSYCISATLNFNAPRIENLINQAAASWGNSLGVRFENRSAPPNYSWCGSDDVTVFDVRAAPVNDPSLFARAFFPDEPRSSRHIDIHNNAFALSDATLLNVLRHELGHALGFRHENVWACATGPAGIEPFYVGPYGARLVTPTPDPLSVMQATNCANPQPQSTSDISAAASLYGSVHLGAYAQYSPTGDTGIAAAQMAIVGSPSGRLDYFATNGYLYWAQAYPGYQWSQMTNLGGVAYGTPAVIRVYAGSDDMDLFVRGSGGALQRFEYRGGWTQVEQLGLNAESSPSAASLPSGGAVVAVASRQGFRYPLRLSVRVRVEKAWQAWEHFAVAGMVGSPSVVSWPDGQIHVFVRDNTNTVKLISRSTAGVWSAMTPLGITTITDVAAVAPYQGRLDVVGVTQGGIPKVLIYKNGWGTPIDLGGVTNFRPAATYVDGILNVIVLGTDNRYYRNRVTTSAGGWVQVGPQLFAQPPAAAVATWTKAAPFVVGPIAGQPDYPTLTRLGF